MLQPGAAARAPVVPFSNVTVGPFPLDVWTYPGLDHRFATAVAASARR
jgi:hypothetical protein